MQKLSIYHHVTPTLHSLWPIKQLNIFILYFLIYIVPHTVALSLWEPARVEKDFKQGEGHWKRPKKNGYTVRKEGYSIGKHDGGKRSTLGLNLRNKESMPVQRVERSMRNCRKSGVNVIPEIFQSNTQLWFKGHVRNLELNGCWERRSLQLIGHESIAYRHG